MHLRVSSWASFLISSSYRPPFLKQWLKQFFIAFAVQLFYFIVVQWIATRIYTLELDFFQHSIFSNMRNNKQRLCFALTQANILASRGWTLLIVFDGRILTRAFWSFSRFSFLSWVEPSSSKRKIFLHGVLSMYESNLACHAMKELSSCMPSYLCDRQSLAQHPSLLWTAAGPRQYR